MAVLLRIVALVLFIIAAILAFATNYSVNDILGWDSVGLAVWVGSTVVPANLP